MTARPNFPLPQGVVDAERITALATIGFPRAKESMSPDYHRQYAHDSRSLMMCWLVVAIRDFVDLFPLSAESEHDARIVAEEVATKEIRRPLGDVERKLLASCLRDLSVASTAIRDADRELARQIL